MSRPNVAAQNAEPRRPGARPSAPKTTLTSRGSSRSTRRPARGESIQEQTLQPLTNSRTSHAAAGPTLDDVAEVCTLLTDPADFDGMSEAYARWSPRIRRRASRRSSGVAIAGLRISVRMVAFTG